MTGETTHNLRGDYSRMRPDYTVDQAWSAYSPAEHDLWRRLYARQAALVPKYACAEFIDSIAALDFGAGIPRFDAVNPKLARATGWQIVAVPGLLPDRVFFEHLANRRFPVTVWIRNPEEFDYIVEPDVFHDFFGHVPAALQPGVRGLPRGLRQGRAQGGRARGHRDARAPLLVHGGVRAHRDGGGLRTYGAGILSSGGELPYCIDSPEPNRIGFDLLRIMRTRYKIDTFQETYFVIRDFRELFEATAPDFTPHYARLAGLEPHAPDAILATDRVVDRGLVSTRAAR